MRYFFILLLCVACTSYQKQGARRAEKLATILSEVHSKHDLLDRASEIKKEFNKIAALAIKAEKHPQEPLPDFPTTSSDMLQYEMMRIASLDGCEGLLKTLQDPAFYKLSKIQ